LLIREGFHYVSGKKYHSLILPETKPECNICFRQNYSYFLLPETWLSAKHRLDISQSPDANVKPQRLAL
jgi:hypothetical protein